MSELLIWTVYDHPRDMPHYWVARAHAVSAEGSAPTDQIETADTLEELRDWLAEQGLTCLARSPEDDPKIVESWI